MRRVDRGQRVGPDWVGNFYNSNIALRARTSRVARPVFVFCLSSLSPPLFSRNTAFFFFDGDVSICTIRLALLRPCLESGSAGPKLLTAVIAPDPCVKHFPRAARPLHYNDVFGVAPWCGDHGPP